MAEMSSSYSIVVDAPIDEVFHAFCDPLIMPDWFTTALEIRGYEPPLAAGKQFEEVGKVMGRELVSKATVTAFEPPHRYVRRVDGPASGEIQHLAEIVEGGVKVSVIFRGELKGFLAGLAAPLVRGQANRQVENDLKSFKAYIER